jgi:hypothetical protein
VDASPSLDSPDPSLPVELGSELDDEAPPSDAVPSEPAVSSSAEPTRHKPLALQVASGSQHDAEPRHHIDSSSVGTHWAEHVNSPTSPSDHGAMHAAPALQSAASPHGPPTGTLPGGLLGPCGHAPVPEQLPIGRSSSM